MSTTEIWSTSEFAKRAGLAGQRAQRRALRLLRGLEARCGAAILVAFGGSGKGARYAVSVAALREHYPAMLDRKRDAADRIAELLGSRLNVFEDRLEACESLQKAGGARIRALAVRVNDLEKKSPKEPERAHVLA